MLKKKIMLPYLPIYAQIVLLLIVFTYVLSFYLYEVNSNKLEQKMFIFPSNTAYQKPVLEIHNIPTREMIPTGTKHKQSSEKIFIQELMLGPQSIYAENPVPSGIILEDVLVHSYNSRSLLFVLLVCDQSISYLDKDLQAMKEWLISNIKRYYSLDTIQILIKKS